MNLEKIIAGIRKLIAYIEARIVLRDLVLAALIIFFGTIIVMQVLKLYTRHNQVLTVPDLSGLTLEEAATAAGDHNMRIEVFDSVYLADREKGSVVDQHPKPGLQVKKNRMIFITMNAIQPARVSMPDLVDLTFRQARAKLESFGLKVGRISYEPDIAINVVLAQRTRGRNLAPGDSVAKGAAVDLVLGKGLSNEHAGIPNLIGMTLEQARIAASDRFLGVGAAVPDQTIASPGEEENAFVFRQNPAPRSGVTLPLGSAIDVWITLDSAKLPAVVQDSTKVN